jgi:hypothetical protein
MSAGSIDGLGSRFLPFRIIHLELADLNSASWNRLQQWFGLVDALKKAAYNVRFSRGA